MLIKPRDTDTIYKVPSTFDNSSSRAILQLGILGK